MTGKPVLAASASANVLFPDPANPVTTTRRPNANGHRVPTRSARSLRRSTSTSSSLVAVGRLQVATAHVEAVDQLAADLAVRR